jgi:hypothetical protein
MSELIIVPDEKEHHLYGGSSAKYWNNCYGWASLYVTLPPSQAGAKADRGTALHKGILEMKVKRELEILQTGSSDTVIDYDSIPNWPIEGADIAERFWKELFTFVLEEFITGKAYYIEKKLMLFPDKDAGGTADFIVLYHNDKAELVGCIVDYKGGAIRVEPDDEQFRMYLSALYLRCKEKGIEIDKFRAVVAQDSHEEFFTDHWYTRKQILRAIKGYEKAVFESTKEKPKYKMGEWCTYCKCKAVCPKYVKSQQENLAMAMNDNKLPVPEQMPDEWVVKLWLASKQIKDLISANNKYVIERFANKQPLPGLKVVAGNQGDRKWKDEDTAAKLLKEKYEVESQVVEVKMLGFPAVEKELKMKGLKPKEIGVLLAPFFTRAEPKAKVTTIDDPKPEFVFKDGASLLRDSDDSGELTE